MAVAIFNIEATTANNAVDSPEEWNEDIKIKTILNPSLNPNLDIIADFATIRLANAFVSKHKKYKNKYIKLDQVRDKPFVIAVAPFEQPFFWRQGIRAVTRVLYGCDLSYEGIKCLDFVAKSNGSKVPLGYFTNEQRKEISAIIFTNTATFGKVRALSKDLNSIWFEVWRYKRGLPPIHEVLEKKDYHETLLDGLHIFHNPYADEPLDTQIFNRPEIVHHKFDIERRVLMENASEGALIMRQLIRSH